MRSLLRLARQSPVHVIAVSATVALTTALASTVFAVVDGVLFRPLPYPSPERLVEAGGLAAGGRAGRLSARDVELLARVDARIAVAATGPTTSFTHAARPADRVVSYPVSPSFFEVIGRAPAVGGFSDADFATADPAQPIPAVVSHDFWQRALGASASPLGTIVEFVDGRIRVAGVLPADFLFPTSDRNAFDMITPLVIGEPDRSDPWARTLDGVVRIAEGLPMPEAQARLDAALAASVDEYPARQSRTGPYVGVRLRPLHDAAVHRSALWFRLAFGAMTLLVVLGAVNVTALSMARARDRRRELEVRAALGAGRADLLRLVLGEQLWLAVAGGLAGLVLAPVALRLALALLPDGLDTLKPPALDWRVAAFAMTAAVTPVLVVGLLPARAMTRRALRPLGARATMERTWQRGLLLAIESAIGVVLVLGGGLVVSSFVTLRGEDVGFDVDRLGIIELRRDGDVPADARAGQEALVLDRLRRAPGVRDAAVVGTYLYDGIRTMSGFDRPEGAPGGPMLSDTPVGEGFFDIAGLLLLEGRTPTRQELRDGAPVAVVSRSVARGLWRGSAVGQTLVETATSRPFTVVGVVEDARLGSQYLEEVFGEVYFPRPHRQTVYAVFLFQADDPAATAAEAAAAISADVPGTLVTRAESMDRALADAAQYERFRSVLFGSAGGLSLLLLLVGVIGLVSTSVAQRTRELGIRAALGATGRRLSAMTVVDLLRPMAAGISAGLVASWWLVRLLDRYLYEITPHDPRVWTTVVAGLLLAAGVAAWLPARRAGRVDPAVVLRAE